MSEAVDRLRIRYRWKVLDAENQAIREHRQKKKEAKSKAERERIGKWEPERMENGETLPQIVSRSKHIILKHWSKCGMNSKRPGLPFSLINSPSFWKDTALA
jgi:transposase